jgi:hypothetical protein
MSNYKFTSIIYASILFITIINKAKAQVGISNQNLTPAVSAMLDVNATNKGILIPRMTTEARNAIIAPATGLLVYDTDLKELFIYNTSWQQATITQTKTAPVDYQTPVFEVPWENYISYIDTPTVIYSPARFYKDALGVVHLSGLIKNGSAGTAIFTLPEGYRPLESKLFIVAATGAYGEIAIFPSGQVLFAVGLAGYVSLEGISFRVD